MTDKNRNKIPDWVENVVQWSATALLLAQVYKKICAGEDMTKVLDVTYSGGEVNVSDKE